MAETQAIPTVALEIISPDGSRRLVRVEESPFLIGRGGEIGNHLQLPDRRISRQCAALVYDGLNFCVEDRGQRRGVFVNGEKVAARTLCEGDIISFGLADSFELIFHATETSETLPQLLSRMEHLSTVESGAGGLRKLSLLLEATALLHSQLPLDAVLGTMVDHAAALTDADRGILLMPNATGGLTARLARQRGGHSLPAENLEPTQTAIRLALEQKRGVVTEDVAQADQDLRAAQSIIAQRLRAVVAIPLYARSHAPDATLSPVLGELLGVLYLDSRRPAAFSSLERQILDALAVECASVLDNARLVERERERERLQQQLGIAREIQQALLPREFRHWAHLQVTGLNQPCLTVGGDYFDVLELSPDRIAFLIADVSGKGLGAALLATMLQGAISGMSIGQDPAALFAHVNRFLCEHSRLERYATAFFGILDSTGLLEFINAGHPSPLLVRHARTEAPFLAGSFPVGLMPEAEFETQTFQLQPSDTLVLFSDGVTEAVDPEDKEFGTARLREAVCGCAGKTIEEVQSCILAAVGDFTRGARQADDLTLLLVRYQGATQAATAQTGRN
jgi:sigma-B regulation protein RsbU (phosphoserine phosphatase)